MPLKGSPTANDYADGSTYVSTRAPRAVTDETAVTLATTMKALFPDARTVIPANSLVQGKIYRLTAFGKATTDATAGNYVFEIALGTGDAPAALAAGATVAASTAQTDVTWTATGYCECRVAGTSGVIRLWGLWEPAVALVASTLQPYTLPSATPANITFNTTASASLTFQLQRSGAGVYTATTTSVVLEELN